MDSFIKSVAAICDVVKAKKHSDKTVNLSFDEWNVWFHSNEQDKKVEKWQVAPPILEDIYTFEDALLVGCILMTLQNNCDRVKMACLAQLVNVIAPIMTENGGKAWAQTIFYPFLYASQKGRGTTMKPVVKCETYAASRNKNVPYLETSVIHNSEQREVILYAVNRSLTEEMELELTLENFGECVPIKHVELYCEDLKAVNTADLQTVCPVERELPGESSTKHSISLKKHSWNMIIYRY